MWLSIIKSFNWIDIFIVILIFRICYIAVSKGFFVEFFKSLGLIFSVFINLHYFTKLGKTLDRLFKIRVITIEIWDFLAFFILWVGVYTFFWLLRQIFLTFVKVKMVSILNKWLSFFLGLLRGVIVASLLMFWFSFFF